MNQYRQNVAQKSKAAIDALMIEVIDPWLDFGYRYKQLESVGRFQRQIKQMTGESYPVEVPRELSFSNFLKQRRAS